MSLKVGLPVTKEGHTTDRPHYSAKFIFGNPGFNTRIIYCSSYSHEVM